MLEEYCYGAVFNCSYLCHKILDNVGADKSATFMLATAPVEMEGLKLYKILTSIPLQGLTGNMSERRTKHKWKYKRFAVI